MLIFFFVEYTEYSKIRKQYQRKNEIITLGFTIMVVAVTVNLSKLP
jgi:hypothetical protein